MGINVRYLTLSLIALSMVGCGKHADDHTAGDGESAYVVDENLRPYIDRFQQDIGVDASYVAAVFGSLSSPLLGRCMSWSNGARKITVDKASWDGMTDLGREQLMYHELGHCAMNMQHDNRTVILPDSSQAYGSMMNEYWFGETTWYSTYRLNYKTSLKNKDLMIP